MRLNGRIKALERHAEKARPAVCGACGFSTNGGDALMGTMVFRVPIPQVIGEPGAVGDPVNDLCHGCGRRLVYRMSVPRVLDLVA